MGEKVYLRWKGKTLLGVVQQTFENNINQQCVALLPRSSKISHQ
jgi:hypothetical protein